MPRFSLPSLFLSLCLAAACGGEMPGGLTILPATDGGPPIVMDAGQPGRTQLCTPTELCERSINECGATITQVSCELWYAKQSNCRDMNEYVACNGDCITEATCSDYFACGNLCFNANCK